MSGAYEVAEERLASSSTHTSAASSAGSAANSAAAKAHLTFVSGSHSAVGAMAMPRASRSSMTGRIPRTSRDAGGTANPTPYAFKVASLRHQMRVNSRALDASETDSRKPRSLALHTLPISESSHLAATDSMSSPTLVPAPNATPTRPAECVTEMHSHGARVTRGGPVSPEPSADPRSISSSSTGVPRMRDATVRTTNAPVTNSCRANADRYRDARSSSAAESADSTTKSSVAHAQNTATPGSFTALTAARSTVAETSIRLSSNYHCPLVRQNQPSRGETD